MSNNKHPRLFLYIALFIISGSAFVFQIILSASLSFLYYNDFRFLGILFGYLGFGVGGILIPRLFENKSRNTTGIIYWGSFCLIVSGLLPFILIQGITSQHGSLPGNTLQHVFFYLTLVASFIHLAIAGGVVSSIYTYQRKNPFRLYFFDLLGAGIFSVVILVLINNFGVFSGIPAIVLANSIGWFFLARSLHKDTTRHSLQPFVIVVVLATALFSFSFSKLKCNIPGNIIEKSWSNSFSLVQQSKPTFKNGYMNFNIIYNCYGQTEGFITDNIESLRDPLDAIQNAPYSLLDKPGNVLVLGSGAGIDVDRALLSGAKHIQAVEINPLIIKIANGFPKNLGKSAYENDRVSLDITDARSFINQANETYDLILISYTKGYFGKPIGSLVFPQQLSTIEAFSGYIKLLSPQGMLAIFDTPPITREYLKTLEAVALSRKINPDDHIIFISAPNGGSDLMLYKNTPFTEVDREKLHQAAIKYNQKYEDVPITSLIAKDDKVLTDDHPYIIKRGGNTAFYSNSLFLSTLQFFIILSVIILIVLSFLFINRFPKKNRGLGLVMYCLGTSLGLSSLEFVFLQKGTQLIGNPTYVHALTLASILIAAAAGSLTLKKYAMNNIKKICIGIILFITFAFLGFNSYTEAIMKLPMHFKILIIESVILPLSYISGAFFPFIINLAEKRNFQMISWIWGIDSVAFVTSGIFLQYSVFTIGINTSLIFGAIGYLISFLSIVLIENQD